jgi:hypothetical protein
MNTLEISIKALSNRYLLSDEELLQYMLLLD